MSFGTNADEDIISVIEHLCYKLRTGKPGTEEYDKIVDNVAKLRASLAPVIVKKADD
jgi:hypothetical protein